MTTEAFVGNMFFERGDNASPVTYDRICQCFGISGVGETAELIDATTFCSGGNKEYVSGLADGEEIGIECNYEQGNVDLLAMIADVKAKKVRHYRVVVEDSSPAEEFTFDGTPIGWVLNPAVDNKNTITFTIKISGEVTVG